MAGEIIQVTRVKSEWYLLVIQLDLPWGSVARTQRSPWLNQTHPALTHATGRHRSPANYWHLFKAKITAISSDTHQLQIISNVPWMFVFKLHKGEKIRIWFSAASRIPWPAGQTWTSFNWPAWACFQHKFSCNLGGTIRGLQWYELSYCQPGIISWWPCWIYAILDPADRQNSSSIVFPV